MRPANTPSAQPPKLLERIRTKHCSIRTEAQYVQWVSRLLKNVARGPHARRTERNEAAFKFLLQPSTWLTVLPAPVRLQRTITATT